MKRCFLAKQTCDKDDLKTEYPSRNTTASQFKHFNKYEPFEQVITSENRTDHGGFL